MRIVTRSTALVILVTALSCFSFCQEDHPIYIVANFIGLDKSEVEQFYASKLSDKINTAGVQGSVASGKNFLECCADMKDLYCAVVYAKIEVGTSNKRAVRVYVVEHLPKKQPIEGKVKDLACTPPMTLEDCYRSLLGRMAQAVKNFDEQCHYGKKCHIQDEQWVGD